MDMIGTPWLDSQTRALKQVCFDSLMNISPFTYDVAFHNVLVEEHALNTNCQSSARPACPRLVNNVTEKVEDALSIYVRWRHAFAQWQYGRSGLVGVALPTYLRPLKLFDVAVMWSYCASTAQHFAHYADACAAERRGREEMMDAVEAIEASILDAEVACECRAK